MARVRVLAAVLLLALSAKPSLGEIKDIGWWKNTIFYQIYPRSFMDSDGDGIGDLKGITSKLDHFVKSGIGGIWLSPIYASPMKDFGYDISNFTAIYPPFGTMDDFEELTKQAKNKSLRVILDLVPNHASDESYWFQQSVKKVEPFTDYFIWKAGNETTPPNNWISVFGKSAWTYHKERKEWYFHQFLAEQPDLNYRNDMVHTAMIDVIQFWLNKGVDGFRIDAVPHLYEVANMTDEPLSNTPGATSEEYTYLDHIFTKDQPETYALIKEWRAALDFHAFSENSHERVMMTEAYTSLEKTVEFYDAGSHIPFNFKFIIDVNKTSPPADFQKIINDWMEEADKRNGTANWVMGNHDRVRTESRYPGRGDQMTMLAMVLPGVTVTYYGEEIGMVDKSDILYNETQDPQGCIAGIDKYKEKSRDPCRTPFQWNNNTSAGFSTNKKTWLPVHENYITVNLEAEKLDLNSHWNLYRNLTTLKKSSQLVNGTLRTVVVNDEILAVIREHEYVKGQQSEAVILLMNFNSIDNKTVNVADLFPESKNSGVVKIATTTSKLRPSDEVNLNELTLDANAGLILLVTRANGAVSNVISFIKATFILLAALLTTFR